jgi:hypothetical protein
MREQSSCGVTAGSAKVAEEPEVRYSAETRTPSGGVLARDCELAWFEILNRRITVPFGTRGVPWVVLCMSWRKGDGMLLHGGLAGAGHLVHLTPTATSPLHILHSHSSPTQRGSGLSSERRSARYIPDGDRALTYPRP